MIGDKQGGGGWQWLWVDTQEQGYLLIKHLETGMNMMDQRQENTDRDAKSVICRITLLTVEVMNSNVRSHTQIRKGGQR